MADNRGPRPQGGGGGQEQHPAPQGRSGGSGGSGGGESPARDLRGGAAGKWLTRKQISAGLTVGLVLISLAIFVIFIASGDGEAKKAGGAPRGHTCPEAQALQVQLGAIPVGPEGSEDWFQFPGVYFRICTPPGIELQIHFEGRDKPLEVDGDLPDIEFTKAVPRFRVAGRGVVTIRSWPPCSVCR